MRPTVSLVLMLAFSLQSAAQSLPGFVVINHRADYSAGPIEGQPGRNPVTFHCFQGPPEVILKWGAFPRLIPAFIAHLNSNSGEVIQPFTGGPTNFDAACLVKVYTAIEVDQLVATLRTEQAAQMKAMENQIANHYKNIANDPQFWQIVREKVDEHLKNKAAGGN